MSQAKPKISVVAAMYNAADCIEPFLRLLSAQTLKDFEVIFVCDKSPDHTEELLQDALQNVSFPYTFVCNPTRGGVGAARDYVLDHGLNQGEFTIFLDADDCFPEDYLQRLYSTAIENNADIAICGFVRIDKESGRIVSKDMCNNPKRIAVSLHESLLSLINPAPWNKLIRTSVIGDSRFGQPLLEDVAFCAYLFPKCRRIAFINEPLYKYYISSKGLISSYATKALPTLKDGLLIVAEQYRKNPDVYLGFYEYLTALAFMRVGIGATSRACLVKGTSLKKRRAIIRETYQYLEKEFPNWRKNEFLSFRELKKRGLKGILLWRCRLLYKLRIFSLFVFEYKLFTSIFKKDIKW